MRHLVVTAALASLTSSGFAHDLGGGSPGGGGIVPRVRIDHWIPGQATSATFSQLSSTAIGMALIVSPSQIGAPLPQLGATLVADPFAPGAIVLGGFSPSMPSVALGQIPSGLFGTLFIQGLVLDSGAQGQAALTNGTEVDVFDPLCAVGNSRQTSNSIQLWDGSSNNVHTTITDSELGYATFSADGRLLYVCEPGSLRDRVQIYDLTQTGAPLVDTISTRAGIRYGCALPRDGRRVYIPVASGVAVHDTDPSSPTYRQEIQFFPTTFTGGTTSIFTGPLDVAVTPDGTKLYVSFGEAGVFPGQGSVGFFDLTQSSPQEVLIPVDNAGTFFNYATRSSIDVSEDGKYAYTFDFSVDPSFPFTQGFQNGAFLNVIDTATNTQVAAVATGLEAQRELAVDRLNEWVYLTGIDTATGLGHVVGLDVREGSPTRFTFQRSHLVDPLQYSEGLGGVDITPDGSTLYVSAIEDQNHATPLVHVLDAETGLPVAPAIVAGSLPGTVSVQQGF